MDQLPTLLPQFEWKRPADADQPFLLHLYASTRDDLRGIDGDPALVASLIAMQRRFQEAGWRENFPAAQQYILVFQGTPIGHIVVDMGTRALRLVDIALLPQARGQGHGSAIVRALQRCAAAAGLPLALSVNSDNGRARRLYLALGFHRSDTNGADALSEQLVWRAGAGPAGNGGRPSTIQVKATDDQRHRA
jgi:ribosomal protein S18 acetylase RimI-like enzyme